MPRTFRTCARGPREVGSVQARRAGGGPRLEAPRRARAPRWGALAALLASASAAPSPARAQQPQQDQPAGPPAGNATSVPRGTDGALITPPAPTAPPTGQPTMPRALNYTPPEYPPEAEKAGLEATVTLQLDIDRTGHVKQAT